MVRTSLARRLHRVGWILVAVGALCAFSIVFLPAGVIGAAAGLLCLLAALVVHRVERRLERNLRLGVPVGQGQPGAVVAGGTGSRRD